MFVCVAQRPYRILQVSWILFLSHPDFGEGKVRGRAPVIQIFKLGSHVDGISKNIKAKINKQIKDFMWGAPKKIARVKWEVMTKGPSEGGTDIKDPVRILDTARIRIFQKLIIRCRQP